METNKKQSAVNWLIEQLHAKESGAIKHSYIYLYDQSRLMERGQHGDTWDAAIQAHEDRGHVLARSICDFDDYFNETFKLELERKEFFGNLTIEDIITVACRAFEIPKELILSKSRKRELVQVRQLIAYVCRENLKINLSIIGKKLGNRDHSTVIHACQTIQDFLDTKDQITLSNLSILNHALKRYAIN
jgi:hypothetical protein